LYVRTIISVKSIFGRSTNMLAQLPVSAYVGMYSPSLRDTVHSRVTELTMHYKINQPEEGQTYLHTSVPRSL
jgi:hypothetical protein